MVSLSQSLQNKLNGETNELENQMGERNEMENQMGDNLSKMNEKQNDMFMALLERLTDQVQKQGESIQSLQSMQTSIQSMQTSMDERFSALENKIDRSVRAKSQSDAEVSL